MKKKINKMMILIATVTILLTMVLITVVYYDLFRRQVLEDLKSYGLLLSNCSSVEEIEQSGVPVESDLRLTIIGSDGRVLYDNEADSVAMGNHSSRPEIREAMQKGLELCDKVHPDLLLGTDPDCDRCGTAVPDGKGGYRLITGNEMGIILLDYICRTRKALGTLPEHPVAVTTIVSTDMATPVAEKYGVELRRTLTGFKFIGEQIGLLEAAGEADRYIFGFEESYGYLSGAHVRDKDAVNATLLVCEAAAWYAKQGMTLLDAINQLYAEFGCYRNALHSFAFEGESGMHTMDAIMKQLRETPPQSIAGIAVESVLDYNAEGTGLPKANVLEFRLGGKAKLMVRPSGTEPKIKVYLSAVAPTEAEADAINAKLGDAAAELLKA